MNKEQQKQTLQNVLMALNQIHVSGQESNVLAGIINAVGQIFAALEAELKAPPKVCDKSCEGKVEE